MTPRDSTWVRGVTSISGVQVDADPSAIAKGDLIKCLLLRDSMVATHLFSGESGSSIHTGSAVALRSARTIDSNERRGSRAFTRIVSRAESLGSDLRDAMKVRANNENNNVTASSPMAIKFAKITALFAVRATN